MGYFKKRGGSRKVVAFVVLCLFILACASTLHAQQGSSVLLMTMRGDLWSWSDTDAKLQQRTNWGFNKNPVVAPTGNQIAYRSVAAAAVEEVKRGGDVAGSELPTNIWLLDI